MKSEAGTSIPSGHLTSLVEPPLVTVVIAGYNQAEFIVEALQSVLDQTYPRIEIILIDNGSTDGTLAVLDPFLGLPGVVLHRYEHNEPITKRLNAAIDASTGDFISLLYGDDLYLPEKIECQVAAFSDLSGDYGVVYSPGYRRNVTTGEQWLDGTITGSGDVLTELLLARGIGRFINPISPLVRRECFAMHPFYEDLFVEGEMHYLRVATTHRFAFLNVPVVVMRDHDKNMGKAIRNNLANSDEMLKRLSRLPTFPPGKQEVLRTARAQLYRRVGWMALRLTADRSWAKACFRTAVGLDWHQALHFRTMAGYTIAALPRPAVRHLNKLGYRLRGNKEMTTFKEEY